MSAATTIFSVVSFITFILVAIPFPWHLEAWNTGTCLFMAWTFQGCLNLFINSVVWRGNMVNWAPVWCDISTKLMVGTSIALPAASLCINRRLYHIASIRTVTATKADRRRGVIIDLSIGLGLPVLFMILQYIVQGHRFDIFEDYGCMTFTYNTPIAYLIVQTPILALELASTIYAILSVIAFKRRTIEFQVLLSSGSGPSANRYLRLMCLAGMEALLIMPITLVGIAISAQGEVRPWISWEDTHFGFWRVDQFLAAAWRTDPGARFALEGQRWVTVLSGLLFFAFFGFAEEARRHYRVAYMAVARRLGANVREDKTSMGFKGVGCISIKACSEPAKVNLKFGIQKISGLTTRVLPKREVDATAQRDSLDSNSTGTLSFQFHDVGGLLSDSKGQTAPSNADRVSASAASPQFEDVGGLFSDLTSSGSETTMKKLGMVSNIHIHTPTPRDLRLSPLWRTPNTAADQDPDLERGFDAGESFLDLSETPITPQNM